MNGRLYGAFILKNIYYYSFESALGSFIMYRKNQTELCMGWLSVLKTIADKNIIRKSLLLIKLFILFLCLCTGDSHDWPILVKAIAQDHLKGISLNLAQASTWN